MEKCMTIPRQWENLVGLTAVDAQGNQIGKVVEVYLNRVCGQPSNPATMSRTARPPCHAPLI